MLLLMVSFTRILVILAVCSVLEIYSISPTIKFVYGRFCQSFQFTYLTDCYSNSKNLCFCIITVVDIRSLRNYLEAKPIQVIKNETLNLDFVSLGSRL